MSHHSLWWLSLLVVLFILLPFTQPHTGPRFKFKNKSEYRLYLSPPFLFNNNTHYDFHKDERCYKKEMSEHGAEGLIPHLLHQIEQKEEGFPFRHNLSKIKIVSTPEEADLILIQSKLKEILSREKSFIPSTVLDEFREHIRTIPSKCGGCDFVMIYASGGSMGYLQLRRWFPRMISVGVDGGSLIKMTKGLFFCFDFIQRITIIHPPLYSFPSHSPPSPPLPPFPFSTHPPPPPPSLSPDPTNTLVLPIPYPFIHCQSSRHHPVIPTYPLVSPLSPRSRLLFFYSVDYHEPLPPNAIIDPQSNAYRSTAVDSINSQAQQKGLGEDVVFVKRPHGDKKKSRIDPTTLISTSNFCLCPRGITPASKRMIHVASLGCIPVILSDNYVPPFSAYIAPFYVQIKQNEVGTLLDQLMALKEDDVRQLKMNLEKYVQAWMWTWQLNEKNLPLGFFLHQLFALGDLNLWMDNDGKRDRKFPFKHSNLKDTLLLPNSLDERVAKFYFSLGNMTQPQSNLSVPIILPKLPTT